MPPKSIVNALTKTGSKPATKKSSAKSVSKVPTPTSSTAKKGKARGSKQSPKDTPGTAPELNLLTPVPTNDTTVEEREDLWELTIKTMHGEFTVSVKSTACVMDLKQLIYEKQGIPVEYHRLQFDSKLMTENEQPLSVYGVTHGAKIYFVLRMRGA